MMLDLNSQATCLIVIDVQVGFRDAQYWGSPANPEAQENVSRLVERFKAKHAPIALVRHDSMDPGSPLSSNSAGNDLEPHLVGVGDVLIRKQTNSAFYGDPNLHEWLQAMSINTVVICGITTNFCCETTARMAGNLGYEVHFVLDATSAFDGRRLDGSIISGKEVMAMSAANLSGEFAVVHQSTTQFLGQLDEAWQ